MPIVLLPVTVTRYTDNYPPGLVECRFTDARGRTYTSREVKQVYVTDTNVDETTAYPVPGTAECVVVAVGGPVATVRFVDLVWYDPDDPAEALPDDHPFEVLAADLRAP